MCVCVTFTLQSGLTPIHVAAFMGHDNIVHQLINHGASPNTSNVVSSESPHSFSSMMHQLHLSAGQVLLLFTLKVLLHSVKICRWSLIVIHLNQLELHSEFQTADRRS